MLGYYNAVHITDGQEGKWIQSEGDIYVHLKKGGKLIIKMSAYRIIGHKFIQNGRVLVHEMIGKFFRGYAKAPGYRHEGEIFLPYHPESRRAIDGIAWRLDETLFKSKGRVRTKYSRGRFIWQEFKYQNRRLAYRVHHNAKQVAIKYPTGQLAAVIRCPGGFSSRSSNDSWEREKTPHSCPFSEIYFKIDDRSKRNDREQQSVRRFDFSKDGNCSFIFYDRAGREHHKGEYKNGQRSGEWMLNGRSVFFLNGIPIEKKLWNTPPEKLKIPKILKIKNAQLRAALIVKVGFERVIKECKNKIIHSTKNGMKLLELTSIKIEEGRGNQNANLRLLKVQCPSTKHSYFLRVPDFVDVRGRRVDLNTCEKARQWTFGVDDPRQRVKFDVET